MKFQLRKTFYPFPVYEFNLPAGHSCPFALECKVMVDRVTGKFVRTGTRFRCYAACAERFPIVRESRWENFEDIKAGKEIVVPEKATHVRIHGSGDFFSQEYFDKWIDVCSKRPQTKFWAFTKSVQFWVNRLGSIPDNLTLQASRGGKQDHLIDEYGLKCAKVFMRIEDVPADMPIDIDDTLAMSGTESFALLDNFHYKKGQPQPREKK
jgi:hypothetical protein